MVGQFSAALVLPLLPCLQSIMMFAFFGGDDSDESDHSFHVEDRGGSPDEDGDDDQREIASLRAGSSSDDEEEGRSAAAAATSSVPGSARSNRSRGTTSSSVRSGAGVTRETAAASATEASSSESEGGGGGDDDDEKSRDSKVAPLTDSSRLKGYITLIVASVVHYDAAKDSSLDNAESDRTTTVLSGVVPADPAQRSYAMAVSIITLIVAMFCAVVHFDRFTCLKGAWNKAFGPGSKIELIILLALSLWWLIATIVLTSVGGIAGPGKGQ